MSAELVRTVFDPFVTTKPVGKGVGLGMHICRSIVEALGGQIAITASDARGTTVRLVLREAEAEDEASPPPEDEASRAATPHSPCRCGSRS